MAGLRHATNITAPFGSGDYNVNSMLIRGVGTTKVIHAGEPDGKLRSSKQHGGHTLYDPVIGTPEGLGGLASSS